jgi:hypothetical protein
MTCARTPTVPHPALPNQTMRPTRRVRRWLEDRLPALLPVVARSADACQADRYRKHFPATAHAVMLLFHGLSGAPSLRQSYPAFGGCPGLRRLSGLAVSDDPDDERLAVSFGHLADSNTTRPAAFLGGLLPFLIAQVRRTVQPSRSALPADLSVVDATFLHLSLKLGRWLPPTQGPRHAGVRVQVQYAPALDLPEAILVTTTRTPDCRGLDELLLDDPDRLAALAGQTLVLDLGYYSHQRFVHLRDANVHFVTRRKADATLTVTQESPIQPPLPGLDAGRITVLHDQRVTVGSPNNRRGAVLSNLRLVTAEVAPEPDAARHGAQPVRYEVLTDRGDLTAQDVVQIYLWRWQIELFFRWLKSHVQFGRLLGYSENAVELSVYLGLVVHLLVVLLTHALGLRRRSPVLRRQVANALLQCGFTARSGADPPARQLGFAGAGWAAADTVQL